MEPVSPKERTHSPQYARHITLAVSVAFTTALVAASFFDISFIWKPVDFLVYRYAADRVISGVDLYSSNVLGSFMPSGGMPFTYTPFAALALTPTTLFDWRIAYALWTLANLGVVAWTIERFTPRQIRHRPAVIGLLMTLACLSSVVMHHLVFGQINLLLMFLVLVDTVRHEDSRFARFFPPGILVGFAAAIKLTPALFIVFYLVTKQWKRFIWSCVGAVGTTAVAFIIMPAVSWSFWTKVVWGLDGRVGFMSNGLATSGNNSVHGLVAAIDPHARPVGWAIAALCVTAGLLAAWTTYRSGRIAAATIIIGLTATIVSPISWIHHWVYLLPGALLIIFDRRPRRLRIGLSVVLLILVTVGPYVGDMLLPGPPAYPSIRLDTPPLLAIAGWIFRESFLLSSIIAATILCRDAIKNARQSPAQLFDGANRPLKIDKIIPKE